MNMQQVFGYYNTVECVDEGNPAYYWSPSVSDDIYNDGHTISLMTKHLRNRKVFIKGEVTDIMANDFVSQMLFLSQSDDVVDIYINSHGESVTAGLVMYDVLRRQSSLLICIVWV